MSDSIKQRMLQARKALEAKEYDKARELLEGIDHPTAKGWLTRLDKVAPKTKRKTKPETGLSQSAIIAAVIVCSFCAIVILFQPSTPEPTPLQVTAPSGAVTSSAIPPTATQTAIPITDPLAQHIFESLSGIEHIENVNSLAIPGRDETQYDFTVRLLDDTNMNATLEAISTATEAYRAENSIASVITLNVLVIQGTRSENWRYSGSEWFLRAIDGVALTATPIPPYIPQVVQPASIQSSGSNQSVAPASASTCNCQSGNTLNCDDFSGGSAQACYNQCMREVGRDVHGLDGNDNDGLACENP